MTSVPLKIVPDSPKEEISQTDEKIIILETQLSEILFKEMRAFIQTKQQLNQSDFLCSALVNFLFQNGCEDKAVTMRYLSSLFIR